MAIGQLAQRSVDAHQFQRAVESKAFSSLNISENVSAIQTQARGSSAYVQGNSVSNQVSVDMPELFELTDLPSPLLPPPSPPKLHAGDIALIVGEPGLMKIQFAKQMIKQHPPHTNPLIQLFLKERAQGIFERLNDVFTKAKAHARKTKEPFVCVLCADFPSLDEQSLTAVCELIRDATSHGISVVITLRPEAEQLCDELPEACICAGRELLYRMPFQSTEFARRAWDMTNGIPRLARAISAGVDTHAPRYLESLQQIVELSLRELLPRAELRLRYAMMLLGSGSFDELRQIIPAADEETLAWMQREAPFFRVSVYAGYFCCAGINDMSLFRLCFPILRQFAGLYLEVVEQAFSMLCRSGNFTRAGICGALLPTTDSRSKLLMPWGVELCAAGALGVMGDSLAAARQLFMQAEAGYQESAAAYALIEEKQLNARQKFAAVLASEKSAKVAISQGGRSTLLLRMLAQSRSLAAGDRLVEMRADAATRYPKLFLHLELRQLIYEGKFHEALRRITEELPQPTCSSLIDMLLINDLALATLFGSEVMSESLQSLLIAAEQTVVRSNAHRLRDYQFALSDLVGIVAGSAATLRLERAVVQAERMGDKLLRAIFSLALALAELKRKNLTSAHVRARRAVMLSRSCDFEYIAACALLVEAVIAALAGDVEPLRNMAERKAQASIPQDLARLLISYGVETLSDRRLPVSRAQGNSVSSAHTQTVSGGYTQDIRREQTQTLRPEKALSAAQESLGELSLNHLDLEALSRGALPQDALWLVRWLVHDCAEISQLCRLKMPKPWMAALEKTTMMRPAGRRGAAAGKGSTENVFAGQASMQQQTAKSRASEQLVAGEAQLTHVRPTHRVVIRLLGGLSIAVDNHTLEVKKFNRRQAKTLLALLAAKDNHRMRRVELVRSMWPDATLELGLQRIYEAISGARKAMQSRYLGFEPFVTNKADGTVALNPEVVICDIDRFVAAAHSCAVSDGAPDEVICAACEARDLYLGDMDVLTVQPEPWISLRADNLRSMFVGAMVSGSRAALLRGKQQLAIQFARSALVTESTREDALMALMEALVAVGRSGDAREEYMRFCSHVVGNTGLPPSRELRRLAADLIPAPKLVSHTELVREDVIGA